MLLLKLSLKVLESLGMIYGVFKWSNSDLNLSSTAASLSGDIYKQTTFFPWYVMHLNFALLFIAKAIYLKPSDSIALLSSFVEELISS